MIKYLLDTNVCIAIIKECPEEVKAKLLKIPIGEIGISSIVLAELWYGIRLSRKREHNEAVLNGRFRFSSIEHLAFCIVALSTVSVKIKPHHYEDLSEEKIMDKQHP